MYKEIIKPTLVLVIISSIISGALALAYNLTGVGELGKTIPANELSAYISEVLPQGEKLVSKKVAVEDPNLLGVYGDIGKKGAAIHVLTKGYGGEMKVLVGLDMDGKVTGIKILDTLETPNIGSKIETPEFLQKYVGKSKEVAIKKDGGEIDGIAGATISSRALTKAVNTAFDVFDKVKGEL